MEHFEERRACGTGLRFAPVRRMPPCRRRETLSHVTIPRTSHMTKDQVEVITSVERRRRKIRHSMRSFELLPLLRPLELRQVALIAYPEDEFTSVPRAIRHSHGRWCPGEGQPD